MNTGIKLKNLQKEPKNGTAIAMQTFNARTLCTS
jgi:hypothetical protein